jgi:hypothetical protein
MQLPCQIKIMPVQFQSKPELPTPNKQLSITRIIVPVDCWKKWANHRQIFSKDGTAWE